MQKTLITILLQILSFISVNAQTHNTGSYMSSIVNDALRGGQTALVQLVEAKKEIESRPSWNKGEKDDYLAIVRILSEVYSRKGMYAEQDKILSEAMRYFNTKDTIANSEYTRELWVCKTKAKADIQDFDAALQYAHEALVLFNRVNEKGIYYMMLNLNIATAYYFKEDYLSAKLYADEAYDLIINLMETKGIPKDYGYYHVQNLRGMVLHKLKHNKEAIDCLKDVISGGPVDDPTHIYDFAVNNLSCVYAECGMYDEAIDLLKTIKPSSVNMSNTANQNIAISYYLKRDYASAAENVITFNTCFYNEALDIIKNFAEPEREPFLTKKGREAVVINNLIMQNASNAISHAFDLNLFCRSVSLAVGEYLTMKSNNNESIIDIQKALYDRTISLEKRDSIKREIIEFERYTLQTDTCLESFITQDIGNWSNIESRLSGDDAVLLFCYAPVLKSLTDLTPSYGVFIGKKGMANPKLIRLCDVDTLDEYLFNVSPNEEYVSNLYSNQTAAKIYNLMWAKIDEELNGIKRIYYSNVGSLANYNLQALITPDGKRLNDKYELVMLSSPNMIGALTKNVKCHDLVAYGAPLFNTSPVNPTATTSKAANGGVADQMSMRGIVVRGAWDELPGTSKEVKDVVALAQKKKIVSKKYLGADATEESFKAMSGHSHEIVHVATHGFVISAENGRYPPTENGHIRSLFLSL